MNRRRRRDFEDALAAQRRRRLSSAPLKLTPSDQRDREQAISFLVLGGARYVDVARAFGLSSSYVKRIALERLRKLGVTSRNQWGEHSALADIPLDESRDLARGRMWRELADRRKREEARIAAHNRALLAEVERKREHARRDSEREANLARIDKRWGPALVKDLPADLEREIRGTARAMGLDPDDLVAHAIRMRIEQ